MAMSVPATTITDQLSRLSISSKKVGAPRRDPMLRLLHRFYEPLVLLQVLDPTRTGEHVYSPQLDTELDGSHSLWRKFLDQLSWICDSKHGGKTVSAVAAEESPSGPIFWLAANSNPAAKTVPHLESVLNQLVNSHGKSPQELDVLGREIIAQCVEFSKDKVKNYSRILCGRVGEAVEILAGNSNPSDVQLLQDLQELEKLGSRHLELCSLAYNFRNFGSLQALSQKHSTGAVPSIWSDLRHYIGRLGSWSKASKILLQGAKDLPQLIYGFSVEYLVPPLPIAAPAPDDKTTLHSALRRMFSEEESDRLQQVQQMLDNFRVSDVSAQFRKTYQDQTFRPRIHAELLLLEHFYHRGLEFVNKDRYIGCSKPSCYCCDLYIKCHPGKFNVRASHGNLWLNWRAPVTPLDDEKVAQKHTKNMLNAMVKKIREDVVFQVESKAPLRPKLRDSTTGITSLVPGSVRTAAKTLRPSDQRVLEYRERQGSSTEAPSLNVSASEVKWTKKDRPRGGVKIGTRGSSETETPGSVDGQDLIESEMDSSDGEVVVYRGRGKTHLHGT